MLTAPNTSSSLPIRPCCMLPVASIQVIFGNRILWLICLSVNTYDNRFPGSATFTCIPYLWQLSGTGCPRASR
jgi:hypothetical protein